MDSELIANFCSITGSNDTTAEYYINAAGGDLDIAIGIFYEASESTAGKPDSDNIERDKDREMNEAPVIISDDSESEKEEVEDDRGKESAVSAASAAVRKSSRFFTPVPAPAAGRAQSQGQRPSVVQIFNSDSEDSHVTSTRDEIFGSSTSSTATASQIRAKRLADLFRPPHAIMFSGTFEMARRRARETGRWLLVTVHVPTEFPCQAMNRDLWNEDLLQSFIQENFIFLQINAGSQECQRYESFYPFDGLYPHTALIDPRTGERTETLLVSSIDVPGFKVVGIREMMEILSEFLGEHPLESSSSQNRRPSYNEVASDPSYKDDQSADMKKSSISTEDPSLTSNASSQAQSVQVSSTLSPGDKPKAEILIPPEYSGPGSVLIQFRLPDGRRQRHRFDPKAPLSTVFTLAAFLTNSGDPSQDSFKLMRGEGELVFDEGSTVLVGDSNLKLNNTMLTIMK